MIFLIAVPLWLLVLFLLLLLNTKGAGQVLPVLGGIVGMVGLAPRLP